MEGTRTPAGVRATPSAEEDKRLSTAEDVAAQVKSPMTPNTEALVERNLAEKQRLLAQLREKAQALEEQITRDSDRLSTARSGRRIRTALVGADSFTPRLQTGRSKLSSASQASTCSARPGGAVTGADDARPLTAASDCPVPTVEGGSEKICLDRPMTGLSSSRPMTSRSERTSMVAMHNERSATGTGQRAGATRMVSATMGTWVRLAQMHEFTKENRNKVQAMLVLADPHGSMLLSTEQLHGLYYTAGFEVSLEQFQKILEAMGESPKDLLNYADFFSHLTTLTFEMPEVFEAQASVSFAPTHMMRILSRRMAEYYKAVKNQLAIEDTEGNGELYRPQLLRVIRATGLQFSEAQLDEVLENIDLLPLNTLNANKFINIFVPHHPVPNSRVDHGASIRMPNAPKEMSAAPTMSTTQLKVALQEKLQIVFSDPHEMFLQMDQSKDGTLTRHDIYRAFQRFGLFPTEKQVDALFGELDVDRKGRIDYQGFLARLAPKPRSHMRNPATSAIDDGSYAAARDKVRAVTASGQRPPTATAAQMQQAVQSKLASKANWERAGTLLRAQDIGLLGRVRKDQLLQVLRKFDIFMTNAQFDDMMVSCLKLPKRNDIDYMEFLGKFEGEAANVSTAEDAPAKRQSCTPVHTPRNLNMLQARAERARESLDRVIKSPKGPTRMLAVAQSEAAKERDAHQTRIFSSPRRMSASKKNSPRPDPEQDLMRMPRTPDGNTIGGGAGGVRSAPSALTKSGPKSRLEVRASANASTNEKESFQRIKGLLARHWEAFQAAFFLLQDEDDYFKVSKKGLRWLFLKYSIQFTPAELDALWRKLTPPSRANLPEGKGGGIDYFDLIRVFGPNLSNPGRPQKPGVEGSGLKALMANSAAPFQGHIQGNWNQSTSDRFDQDTGNHSGRMFGSKVYRLA